MEKSIKRLSKVEFPMELESFCEEIRVVPFGRYDLEKEPPYEWHIFEDYHPHYGVKIKLKLSEWKNGEEPVMIYDAVIWKKRDATKGD